MFGKKPLLAKKRATKVAFQMATIVYGVDNLIAKKALKIELGAVLLYPELLKAAYDRKAYVKNLFLYCRLKNILQAEQVLYVKDIETGQIIAQFIDNKSLVFV